MLKYQLPVMAVISVCRNMDFAPSQIIADFVQVFYVSAIKAV